MKRNTKAIIWLCLFISVSILFKLYGAFGVECYFWAKWHLLNGGKAVIGSIEFDLPFNWYARSNDANRILIDRIPHLGNSFFFLVGRNLTKKELDQYSSEKIVDGRKTIRMGDVSTLTIDNETAYYLEYRVECSCNDNNTMLWSFTVPARSLVIEAFFVEDKDNNIVLSELIANIKFK